MEIRTYLHRKAVKYLLSTMQAIETLVHTFLHADLYQEIKTMKRHMHSSPCVVAVHHNTGGNHRALAQERTHSVFLDLVEILPDVKHGVRPVEISELVIYSSCVPPHWHPLSLFLSAAKPDIQVHVYLNHNRLIQYFTSQIALDAAGADDENVKT